MFLSKFHKQVNFLFTAIYTYLIQPVVWEWNIFPYFIFDTGFWKKHL